MKLWDKNYTLNKAVEAFTVDNDYELDMELIPYDCRASIAHAKMLHSIGILDESELDKLVLELEAIIEDHGKGRFTISPEQEDCHTAIEARLTEKLGGTGKKIHTGRSRNDQVLTALRLYEKERLGQIHSRLNTLQKTINNFSEKFGEIVIPGYTHTRKAMPTTVKTWAEAFYYAFSDDADLLDSALRLIDQNPMGTGAGYGVPLDLDREMTTRELGFSRTQKNPIHAQNSRAKFEGFILSTLGMVMFDMNKMASDLVFYTMPGLDYFKLPETFLTGSSIMPQKKNPDVLEILRARYSQVLSLEIQIRSNQVNLISGYHRDVQLTKEPLMKALGITQMSIDISILLFESLSVNKDACKAAMTEELFATKRVYELVAQGMPFRDAYKKIALSYTKAEHEK